MASAMAPTMKEIEPSIVCVLLFLVQPVVCVCCVRELDNQPS